MVVTTGDATEVGRISDLIAEAHELQTPLTRKIAHFSKLLLFVILGLAVVTAVVGLLRGEALVDMFLAAVALAVGAIPEGLPAAVTITLAIGVSRMAHRRAIIRKLPAVETLGSTTVICSDKTGTLTENQMTVQRIATRRPLLGHRRRLRSRGRHHRCRSGGRWTAATPARERSRCPAVRRLRRTAARRRALQRQLPLPRRRAVARPRGSHRGCPAGLGRQGRPQPRGADHELPAVGHGAFRVRAPVHGHPASGRRTNGRGGRIAYRQRRRGEGAGPVLATSWASDGSPRPLDADRVERGSRRDGLRGPAGAGLCPQGTACRYRRDHTRASRERAGLPRSPGHDRPAAPGGARGDRGLPCGRHPGEDDHG